MTMNNQKQYSERLAAILNIPAEDIEKAMMKIVREDVLRIARNDRRVKYGKV